MEKNHDYREKENFGIGFFLALDMGTSSSSNYGLKTIHSQWPLITASIETIIKKRGIIRQAFMRNQLSYLHSPCSPKDSTKNIEEINFSSKYKGPNM
jgi:hypothetical protein